MGGPLDVKDLKILYELDVNSRQTNAQIAKKIGLSKQIVGFRIKRLLAERIISSCHTVIDISKLGFSVHKSFLRLQNLNGGKEERFLRFLVNHPNVVWVASCDGKYDLAFGTWAKDIAHLDGTLSEVNRKFGAHIAERQIATIIRGEYFARDYLISKKAPNSPRESFFGAIPSPVKMDRVNWEVLLALGRNARTPAIEMAEEMQIGADTVSARIRKLESTETIRRYNIVPNESRYPYVHYKVLLGLRNVTDARERAFVEYCRAAPNIVYLVKSLGPWEFEIDLEVDNAGQFRAIMMAIKTAFNDILKDYSALHIYQVHKYNFCPSIAE